MGRLRQIRLRLGGPTARDRPLAMALALAILVVATGIVAWTIIPDDHGRRASPGAKAPPGFVYRDGHQLYLDGRPYRFVGINYPWANAVHQVGCGPAVDDATLDRVFEQISKSGSAVRAWFYQPHVTVGGVRDWTGFDRTLGAARAHGLKVVVTLADADGYCGADPPGRFKDIGWYRSGYAETVPQGFPTTYREYVREVVTRYADRPEILAWQLMNEANVVTLGVGCADEQEAARALRAWADDMAGMIHSIDPHHLISIGTGLQGSCGSEVTAEPANNSYHYVHSSPHVDLCEYHDYRAPTAALFSLQRLEMDACNAAGKAFFVGELGIDEIIPNRPALLAAKLEAQFAYTNGPVQGVLVWRIGGEAAGGFCDRNCVRLGDPVLDVLAAYEQEGDAG